MSILNPLADLVAWVIMRIHSVMGALFGPASGAAWGLSIVILVVLIRVCLIPLFVKQVHAQRKMAQHAPQLAELRKKYKNDKQRLNEETMKFYKENGVNPLAGCLPMIPQMIIFFSLFYVLRAIAEWKPGQAPKYGLTVPVLESAQKATIFGVHLYDKLLFPHTAGMGLTASIVAAITVTLSATTTFMTVRQSSKRGLMQTNVDPDNPMAQSQKYMMYIVPFFSLTGLYWQFGLVLYWVTTNLWTLGQQYFMFRNWTTEPTEAAGATAAAASGPAKTTAKTASGTAKTASGTAKTASGTAKTASGTAKTASAARGPRSATGGLPRVRRGPRRGREPAVRPPRRPGSGRVRPLAMPPLTHPVPRTGRMVPPSVGCWDWAGRNRRPPPSRKCPRPRWSGSSRSGRPKANGRGSGSRRARTFRQQRSTVGGPVVSQDVEVTDEDETLDEAESTPQLSDLELEGDIAADYVEGLLDIADLDGDIDMDVEGDRAIVSVVGATLDELVGDDGEVLEALQELTRLAVHRQTGIRARLMLDIGGYRARRRAELADYGRTVAEEVARAGQPKALEAMSPFERKIVHDAVAAAGLRSESEGEEPNRRVVVFPAQ